MQGILPEQPKLAAFAHAFEESVRKREADFGNNRFLKSALRPGKRGASPKSDRTFGFVDYALRSQSSTRTPLVALGWRKAMRAPPAP